MGENMFENDTKINYFYKKTKNETKMCHLGHKVT